MNKFDQQMKVALSLVFLFYILIRVGLNIPAFSRPRDYADTDDFLRISKESIGEMKFWADERPFVFPLLLKIFNQHFSSVVTFQLAFSITSWGVLALTISASFRHSYFSFVMILALSLVRHLAGWDYSIMSESLSISWFVLLLACGIWLMQEWHIYKVFLLAGISFFFGFTRDTNSYFLLILAGMLIFAVIVRLIKPNILILVSLFITIFLMNNFTANLGKRWVFPMNNNMGRRILVSYDALEFFKSCGMPINSELLLLANSYAFGPGRAFYTDPALEDYRHWLDQKGMFCYVKWLLSRPIKNVFELFNQVEGVVRFDQLNGYLTRKFDPVIPIAFEGFIYPMKFTAQLWFALTTIALIAIWKHAWQENSLWGIYILLCLSILPHFFIIWHGDVMEPQRHGLIIGLQFSLCYLIIIFLLYDRIISRWEYIYERSQQ